MDSIFPNNPECINIHTPDQRVRVFVSSTLRELSPEREVVKKAIEQLHLIPVLFELGARPHPARELYRAYLSQSHIFIGIYWQSYGWVAPEMEISGLEDEYQLARNKPRLIYIKNPAPEREQKLSDLIARIKEEDLACYKYFSSLEELGELIATDLSVLLSERFESTLEEQRVASRQSIISRNNLPQELTQFIGREQMIASIIQLMEEESSRLITLTGSGGVGKTRLALKVAAQQVDRFADGIWLVELAALTDPALVVYAIAEVLGLREEKKRTMVKTLVDYLYEKSLLLVFDNCEHLIDEVAHLATTLLRGAPKVRIMTTSREPLGVEGELVRSIDPLSVPALRGDFDIDELLEFEAVNLFVTRAMAVKPDFAVTEENASAVAQICTRLDGIPLAIELAAARLTILPVGEIAARLDDRFRLLVGKRTALPRQQTLRALIDWSHELLSAEEQILFRRLSIFAGGWTLEAAEEVCSADGLERGEILSVLMNLVDKSLVIPEPIENGRRYRFLDTIQQFSRERLLASEEFDETAQKHGEYYFNMAESVSGELWGSRQCYWLDQLSVEHDNLRLSMESLARLAGEQESFLRMAGSLWRFWEVRGFISEGRGWLERALEMNPDADAYLRANALRGAGILACKQGDYDQAQQMHKESLALFSVIGFKVGIGRQLDELGDIAWQQGDYPKALELHTESLALRYEIKDQGGIAASLVQLGKMARERGKYQYASELLEASLEISRELENDQHIAISLNNLGLVAYQQCEYDRSNSYFDKALAVYLQLGDKRGAADTMQNMGDAATAQGDFKKARQLFMDCLKIRREIADRHGIAETTAHLAEVAFFQGNYAQAKECADESFKLFEELGAKRGIILSSQILAYIAHYQGSYARSDSLAQESLDMSIEIELPRRIAYAKGLFGLNEYAQGNLEAAMDYFQEVLSVFSQVEDKKNIAHTLVNMARCAYRQGDTGSSLDYLEDSLSISRELGLEWSRAFSLEIKGLLLRSMGQYQDAFDLFMESLLISVDQMNLQGIDNCLGALAGLAVMAENSQRAARLFAFTEKVRDEVGVVLGRHDQLEYDNILQIVQDQLDGKSFESAWQEGSLMTLDQVLDEMENWRSSQSSEETENSVIPQRSAKDKPARGKVISA